MATSKGVIQPSARRYAAPLVTKGSAADHFRGARRDCLLAFVCDGLLDPGARPSMGCKSGISLRHGPHHVART